MEQDIFKITQKVFKSLNEGIENLSSLEKADLEKLKQLVGQLTGSLATTGMSDDEIMDSLQRLVAGEIRYSLS